MFHTISSTEPKVYRDRVNKRRKWGKKNLQSLKAMKKLRNKLKHDKTSHS